MEFELVSIDQHKRSKIMYAAGFIVAAMTLFFLLSTAPNLSYSAGVILMGMVIVFALTGLFFFVRAGKIYHAGKLLLSADEIILEQNGEVVNYYFGLYSEVNIKDEGFHSYKGRNGKILTLTFHKKESRDLLSLQLFFPSEKNLAEFLSPLNASGIPINY